MSARITLFDILRVSTERGGTAVADRLKGLALMSAGHVTPLREELFFVGAEDIGHFEPMFSHRSRSSEPNVSNGLRVERTAVSERCR